MARKIPRGKGYDKASTLAHLRKMVKGGTFVTEYVKQAGLKLDTFILAVLRHGPDDAPGYLAQDSKLIEQECEQCKDPYWPSKKGTRFCSPYCGNMFRKDREYFGGKRDTTVGLEEAVCQLCERVVSKGLSSHHIYGKSNDPDNEFLLALCKGCHAIVSDLAIKTWCGDESKLQKLVWLAVSQRNGAEMIRLRKEERCGLVWTVSSTVAHYPAP